MDKPFFVMLSLQNGSATPLTEDDGEVAFFARRMQAEECAESNPLGKALGWEVFMLGMGESQG